MSIVHILSQKLLSWLPDKEFSILQFAFKHHRLPNLSNPQTFNEKLSWIKLYHHPPLMQSCADKYTVRAYVKERVGEESLPPLLGVYDNAHDMDFDSLPDRFVMKASHGSGWNILCRDKSQLERAQTIERLNHWLKTDFSHTGRELAYRNLKGRIVVEAFLEGPNGEPPVDYKFQCFHGEPRFIQADFDRFTNHTRALYDLDWQRLPVKYEYPLYQGEAPRPKTLEKMADIARRLSEPFRFVRVDLYEVDDHVYFGEMTFTPGKGVEAYEPAEWDTTFGQWLDIEPLIKAAKDNQ